MVDEEKRKRRVNERRNEMRRKRNPFPRTDLFT